MLTSRPRRQRQTTCQSTSAAEVRAALRFAGTHGYFPERFLHIDTARVALRPARRARDKYGYPGTGALATRGSCMLFYRAALPLSSRTLNYAAGIIRRHLKSIGSRWRKLNPGQQAMLVLVYLRKGEQVTPMSLSTARSYRLTGSPRTGRSTPASTRSTG